MRPSCRGAIRDADQWLRHLGLALATSQIVERCRGRRQPALFVTEHGETVAYGSESLPGKTVLNVDLFVYIAAGKDPDCIPARDLNVALDALQSCLAPGPAQDRQTLGGLVAHCRIEGRIVKDPGDLDGQGLALVPVKIFAP